MLAVAGLYLLFLTCISVWTYLLLIPDPLGEVDRMGFSWGINEFSLDLKFVASKTTHLIAYSFLTFLGLFLPLRPRYRLALILFILGHAVVTEIIQVSVPGRSGRYEDVIINWTGILIGYLANRLVRAKMPTRPDSQ